MRLRLASDTAARRRLGLLLAAAVLAGIVGLIVGAKDVDRPASRPTASGVPAGADAQRGGAALELEQQIGQLLVMSFDGTVAPPYILRRLRDGQGAGVIVFGKNLPDPATTKSITAAVQRAAAGGALVMTDQEGGEIRSLAFAAPEESQGAQPDAEAAGDGAREAARGLRAAGVNVNLAPVADVVPPGGGGALAGRAYPGDRTAVAGLVSVAVREHERAGVGATAKHFPGLGRALENTDDASETIAASRSDLERDDLGPFRAAVSAGVPLVMSSHASYPALDRERIASQSPTVIGDVLRGDLGFGGVVVTDSIEAQAVLDRSDIATAAERSLEAGNDLILMTGSGSWNEVYPRLLNRARRDDAFRKRVTESADRVLRLKRKLGLKIPGD